MAIKVIAQLREVKLGKNPGKKFVMRPENENSRSSSDGRGFLFYSKRTKKFGNNRINSYLCTCI